MNIVIRSDGPADRDGVTRVALGAFAQCEHADDGGVSCARHTLPAHSLDEALDRLSA